MRVSTVAVALFCLVTGYLLLGTRVNATEDTYRRLPVGMNVGSQVRLSFSSDPKSVSCKIDYIDAGWLRCAGPDDPFNKPQYETWYDVAHVVSVSRDVQR